jgi:hypothetical protein
MERKGGRTLVEWSPSSPDYFVAGSEDVQLYEVQRQRRAEDVEDEEGGLGGETRRRRCARAISMKGWQVCTLTIC